MPPKIHRPSLAALVVLSLIWGYNWIFVKEGLRYAGPFVFGALRGIPAALVLFGAVLALRKPLKPVALASLFVLGLFQTAGFVICVNLALIHGAVGKTTVLVYTFPFWTLLFAWPLLGERIRGLQWLAAGLAGLGLTLVLEPWNLGGGMAGKLFAVGAGICWSLASVMVKWLRARHSMDLLSLTAWQMLLGGIVLAVVAWRMPEPAVSWTPPFVLALGYAMLLGTAAGWLLWLYVLQHLPAGTASLSLLAVPVLGVLLSRLHYDEQPGGVEIAGMALIGASLAVLSWLTIRRQRPLVPELAQE